MGRGKLQEAVREQSFIGKPFTDIIQKDPDGNEIKLSDFKGHVILIDFWASWCKPCRNENPNVVAVYNKYKSKNFTIFSVSLDDNKADWIGAIKSDGLVWKTHVAALDNQNNTAAKETKGAYNSFIISNEKLLYS